MGEDNGTARKIIACATVAEELRLMGVPEGELLELEFGLHVYPDKLRETLQGEIDAVPGEGDIVLGYGLCSNAAVGLVSRTHRIIIPRVDDCIALFLGSRREHLRRLREEPGTYFLTKVWISAAELPINDYLRMVERYGEERALRVTRVCGEATNASSSSTPETMAGRIPGGGSIHGRYPGAELREIPGSNRMLRAMLTGTGIRSRIVEPGERPPWRCSD